MIKLKQSHPYQVIIHKAQISKKHTDAHSFDCLTDNQKHPTKKLANSNSNYLLHSNNKARAQLSTLQERMNRRSQQRYETKATIRHPRQYVPLSKVSPSPSKYAHQRQQQIKQLQYLQSQAYQRYLQQICRNASSNKDKVNKIKSIRSNNIYLANSKQQQNKIANTHDITYHQLTQANSLSNLSKITEKNNILIQDPFDSELNCYPYLQNSSVHQNKFQQNVPNQIKIIACESRRKLSRPGKDSFDQKHTVRSSVELANKIANKSKKFKAINQQNTNQTLRFNQPQSIYNVDFKLKRPPPIASSSHQYLSRSKSQGKKFIIVTSTEKNLR